MARVRAILASLWIAARRNQKSLTSFSGNHLFYAGAAFLFLQDSEAFVFFVVIIGLVLFFPLTTDPLLKIPQDRLAVWPLTRREHWLLRILSPLLNPMTWLLIALLVWKRLSPGVWVLLACLCAVGFIVPRLRLRGSAVRWARMPNFPGPLNQVIRKNCRELASTLDFYSGLVLAVPACVLRVAGLLPSAALLPMTLLIMVAISTYPQCLFGLDGEGGLTRYRLLALHGWQILLAKDAAFLLLALLVTLPMHPLAGLTSAFMALATGHHTSVVQYHKQKRWRFQTSPSFGASAVQLVLMISMASGTAYMTPFFLVPCAAAYAVSTWWFGRVLERQF